MVTLTQKLERLDGPGGAAMTRVMPEQLPPGRTRMGRERLTMAATAPPPSGGVKPDRWPRVQAKILAASAYLFHQGAVVSRPARRGRVWMLRYYVKDGERRIQKAIYIAGDDDPELLAKARDLLAACRRRQEWLDEIATATRVVASIRAAAAKLLRHEPRDAAGV